jgi:hypothetical protein
MTPRTVTTGAVIVVTLQYFNLIYAHVALHVTELTAAQKSQLAHLAGILQSRARHSTRELILVLSVRNTITVGNYVWDEVRFKEV